MQGHAQEAGCDGPQEDRWQWDEDQARLRERTGASLYLAVTNAELDVRALDAPSLSHRQHAVGGATPLADISSQVGGE